MTVAQAVATVCASEHLKEDFVLQLFKQNNNGLVAVLTQLSYMSQDQKDKYRYPHQRLCVKTGIDEEVCKQALEECNNDEKVALQYLTITNSVEVKKEITVEMGSRLSKRTGMDFTECMNLLREVNGNEEKAVEKIKEMSSFKREITVEMGSRLSKRTGMDFTECMNLLRRTNGDEEEAVSIIATMDNIKREITVEMGSRLSKRTGMDFTECMNLLRKTNGDEEKAVEIISKMSTIKCEITVEMGSRLSKRTGMDFTECMNLLRKTNGDEEEAVRIISEMSSFKREITVEMGSSLSKRTGVDFTECMNFLRKTNGDEEKAIELIFGKEKAKRDALNYESGFVIHGNTLVEYKGNEECVTIPTHVDTIGREAFYNNTRVKTVILPQNISIEDEAFRDCENLRSISQNGEKVIISRLGDSAFWGCEKLTTDIVFTGKRVGSNAFYGCSSITKVLLKNEVDIDEDAFQDCEKLTHICEIGSTWIAGNIEEGAFYGCQNLVSKIQITENVVRRNAFYYCNSLKSVLLPDGVSLEEDAFQDCEKLENISSNGRVITISHIEEGAFYGCENLCTAIRLIKASVPENAFYGCSSLTKVDIPDGTDIGEEAFQDCERLKSICGERSIFVAGKLGEGAFWGCESLVTPIKITDSVLPANVFYDCSSLKAVYLPTKISIDEDAFDGCDARHLLHKDLPSSKNADYTLSQVIDIKMDEIEDNIIGFQDFIVKTDVYNCRKKGHELKEITAIIFCMNCRGEVVEKQVMAGYCKDCQRYYILNREFERLKTNYRILCRVIDNSVVTSSGTGVFADLNQESVMKQYGYTVNQQDGLSTAQRQTILEFLVAANILTKAEICSHLDWLISSRGYDQYKFRVAIKKWTDDRDYIAGYQLSENRKVIVNKITKGKVRQN